MSSHETVQPKLQANRSSQLEECRAGDIDGVSLQSWGADLKVFVVNLDRDQARWVQMKRQLDCLRLDYERVSAVDGRSSTFSQMHAHEVDSEFWKAKGNCTAACALSHFRIYEKMVQMGCEMSLILEDDLIISEKLPQLLYQIWNDPGWNRTHLCLLYTTITPEECRKHHRLEFFSKSELGQGYRLCSPAPELNLFGAGAYILSLTVARNFLSKAYPVRTVADNWSFFQGQGCFDDLRVVFPHPVDTGVEVSSRDPAGGSFAVIKKKILDWDIPFVSSLYRNRLRRSLSEHLRKRQHCLLDGEPLKEIFA